MADAPADRYLRFTLSDRLEHWAQIATFVPLAVTGLVQRYSEAAISKGIIDLLGGIEATRVIHRVFAALPAPEPPEPAPSSPLPPQAVSSTDTIRASTTFIVTSPRRWSGANINSF